MLREDDSKRKRLKELCHSLLAVTVGLASWSLMAVLSYFTYQAAAGNRSFCNPWTDIPGRLMLLITSYYGAGVCGILPIPERLRINSLPRPFILYKFESWKRLFRNLRLLLAFDRQPYDAFENDLETSPLRNGVEECFYDCFLDHREKSDKFLVAKTDTPKKHTNQTKKTARDRDAENNSSEEHNMSFDSPIGGHIVPMVKGESSKPRYLSDSSSSTTTESSENSNHKNPQTETLKKRAKMISQTPDETDIIPKTPDVQSLPSYPRFPWDILKHRGSIPKEAKALHRRHLMIESRELNRQKTEDEESEHDSKTNNDGFNPFTNSPISLRPIPLRSKIGFHGRTRTTPYSVRKLGKLPFHKRTISITAPRGTLSSAPGKNNLEPEDNSRKINKKTKNFAIFTDHQSKVERTKETLKRFGPSFQAGNEVSTSKQNINDLPSKIFDMFDTDDESAESLNRTKSSKK